MNELILIVSSLIWIFALIFLKSKPLRIFVVIGFVAITTFCALRMGVYYGRTSTEDAFTRLLYDIGHDLKEPQNSKNYNRAQNEKADLIFMYFARGDTDIASLTELDNKLKMINIHNDSMEVPSREQ